ncbi:MAG: hypothetical protein AABX75_01970 [Nanoarchaeota archaeon]
METNDLEQIIIGEQETLFEMAGRLQRRTAAEVTLKYEKAISVLFAYVTKVKEIPTREEYEAQLEKAKEERLKLINDDKVRKKVLESFDSQKANYARDIPQRLLAAMQSYLSFANIIRHNYALLEEAAAMGARVMRVPGSQQISMNDFEAHNEVKNTALLLTNLVIYAELITPEEAVKEVWEKLLSSPRDKQFNSYQLRKQKITEGKDRNALLNIGERTYESIKNDASITKAQEKVAGNKERDLGGMYG